MKKLKIKKIHVASDDRWRDKIIASDIASETKLSLTIIASDAKLSLAISSAIQKLSLAIQIFSLATWLVKKNLTKMIHSDF